jgi:hypothetical protein
MFDFDQNMIATRKHSIDVVIAPAAPDDLHQPTGPPLYAPVGLVFLARKTV